jgi:hypothetical protein
MKYHLLKRALPCPATKNDVTLTDEIKQYILDNRIYRIPQQPAALPPQSPQQVMNQTINNYNMIYNIINKMPAIEKVTRYNEYKNVELVDFEDSIDEKYHLHALKLSKDKYKDYQLEYNDFKEIIDKITTITDVPKLNIIYDNVLDKLQIFHCGEWVSFLMDSGIKDIIEKIQGCYLNAYECFLIRRIYSNNTSYVIKQQYKESLKEYYRFLACFDIDPFIKDKDDSEILDDDSIDCSDYNIQEEWYAKYKNIDEVIMKSDINRTKKEINNIIKNNTKASILELNKKVMEIMQMDEEFKTQIIQSITHALD